MYLRISRLSLGHPCVPAGGDFTDLLGAITFFVLKLYLYFDIVAAGIAFPFSLGRPFVSPAMKCFFIVSILASDYGVDCPLEFIPTLLTSRIGEWNLRG